MLNDSFSAIDYRAAKDTALARPDATSCGGTNSLHIEQLQGSQFILTVSRWKSLTNPWHVTVCAGAENEGSGTVIAIGGAVNAVIVSEAWINIDEANVTRKGDFAREVASDHHNTYCI
jgi:hypothetical protein